MPAAHRLNQLTPVALAAALAFFLPASQAQTPGTPATGDRTLATVKVEASADASAEGLAPPYAGGQVARGGRAGILGTRDPQETPFSITSYTNDLIQDRQARSVGEVLQNDPGVRMARGFGNFQESFFIRGFILGSDDIAYNGLFSLLPRQYIATELFERVEVLRGASTFLTGANPGGGGLGGSINLLPKRATKEPLTRVTVSAGSGGQGNVAADIGRRFGPDGAAGIRVNAAYRDGGTAVDNEKARLGLAAVGLDWRSRDVRLSGDLGWQDNRLRATRPNVSLGAVTSVPAPPDASSSFAQPWSYSNERDVFGTLRGEWDLTPSTTAWAAYGARRGKEANSLANPTVDNASTGSATVSRFDNTREDRVGTGEVGLRGKLRTGAIGHEWVVSAARFQAERDNAFGFDFLTTLRTNIYRPVSYPQPAFGPFTFFGGKLEDPLRTGRTVLTSVAVGDTLSLADDRLLLTLGLRHQKLAISSYDFNTGAQQSDYERSRNSPAVAAVWKFNRQWSLYANYIEGLTQGDTAPASSGGRPVANAGQALSPYVSKQKEIGVKYDGGRLGGSLALFSTSKPRGLVDASGVFTDGGSDRHRGAELNVFGEATRGLRLLGGATWLDARQQSTGSAATDGRRVIGVPSFQSTLGAEWDVPMLRGLALDARVVHTGSSYADSANTLKVPAWTRLDLGARYLVDVGSRLVTLRARVDNATNRNYWASAGGFPGIGYLVLGAPRTFTLSASVDF